MFIPRLADQTWSSIIKIQTHVVPLNVQSIVD